MTGAGLAATIDAGRCPRSRWPRKRIQATAVIGLLAVLGTGCAMPSWVPYFGRSKPGNLVPAAQSVTGRAPSFASAESALDPEDVVDRVICVVNNDAITQFDLDEAELFFYQESRQPPVEGDDRRALRERLLGRMIESRLQLQQAQREKVTVEDVEVEERLAEVFKQAKVSTDADRERMLRAQGLTLEAAKRRVRDQVMVQKLIRRKVGLRVSVTEEEIDQYLVENRDKLETGLTFDARHMLFLPGPEGDEEAWQDAERRAGAVHGLLVAGGDFAELAREHSQDGTAKDGGSLGTLRRGELAPDIERAILALKPGEASGPFRSEVGWHVFKLDQAETLSGARITQLRGQVRDILLRDKYEARLREWLAEIKDRAVIEIRDASLRGAIPAGSRPGTAPSS
jgi:peptidyl-prolyl cis-trans isomerase SurA